MVGNPLNIGTTKLQLISTRKSEISRCTSVLCNHLQCLLFYIICRPGINVFGLAPYICERGSCDIPKTLNSTIPLLPFNIRHTLYFQ
jgi:hypothetical protein